MIRTGAWGPIAAMALTFFSALFIPLQDTIFLGAVTSLLLYVGASSRKFSLQQAVRLDEGGWEMQDAPKTLTPNQATVLVSKAWTSLPKYPRWMIRCRPRAASQMPAVILVVRDMHHDHQHGDQVAGALCEELQGERQCVDAGGRQSGGLEPLKKSGALDMIGAENVFPATVACWMPRIRPGKRRRSGWVGAGRASMPESKQVQPGNCVIT